jgi:hypothetical protein
MQKGLPQRLKRLVDVRGAAERFLVILRLQGLLDVDAAVERRDLDRYASVVPIVGCLTTNREISSLAMRAASFGGLVPM